MIKNYVTNTYTYNVNREKDQVKAFSELTAILSNYVNIGSQNSSF